MKKALLSTQSEAGNLGPPEEIRRDADDDGAAAHSRRTWLAIGKEGPSLRGVLRIVLNTRDYKSDLSGVKIGKIAFLARRNLLFTNALRRDLSATRVNAVGEPANC